MTNQDINARMGVALIGAGMIAPTHVAALSAMRDQLRLGAVVSRHPENAAYLAAQIMATADDSLAARVIADRQANAEAVMAKNDALQAKLQA